MTLDSRYIVNLTSTSISALFLLVLPFSLWKLRNARNNSSVNWRGYPEAAISIVLSIILLSYTVKLHVSGRQPDGSFLVSLFVSALASLGLGVLLLLGHQRSPNFSTSATLYLLTSILCDTIYLTLPSHIAGQSVSTTSIVLRCITHSVLLALENVPKHPAPDGKQSVEERHGILSRVLFLWIHPLLLKGYRNVLVDSDLPSLSRVIKPEFTRKAILRVWSHRAKPETKRTLPVVLLKCLKHSFLAAIIPRLFLIVFRYSQPVLIKESIRYVVEYHTQEQYNRGYWLVVSALGVYIGLAVSTAVYKDCINRLELMTKSSLIGLIHDKTVNSSSVSYDDGEATTLMSTDADSLADIGSMVHETWAQVVEVIIGVGLLASQVGWIWPLPLVLIYLCSHVSRFVAKHLQPHQKAWNYATQQRVAATSSMLSEIKIVKMLGFQHSLTERVGALRENELWAASKLRWVMVYYNASANALGLFTPAITLVVYAAIARFHGRNLNTETAFTTVAILTMVTHPANMVMTIVPRAVASFAGFERIRAFLLRPSLEAHRVTLPDAAHKIFCDDFPSSYPSTLKLALHVRQLSIGQGKQILKGVNIEVATGSFAIISGSTGSGKTTLLRAILGEVVPTHGSISLPTHQIAYCAQKPWLPSGTISEIIHGAADAHDIPDEGGCLYKEVLNACCLTHDLASLPEGDQTEIGSRGMNLSGGQRQRVALARALFAKCDMLLLDDTFSGLDGETEQAVFDNLFGPTGLIRGLKTTVILVSNSSQYFHAADHIVVLGDNSIVDQGTWERIGTKATSIAKFHSGREEKDSVILPAGFDKLGAQFRAKDEAEEDLSRQTGDSALYGYYFRFIGFANISTLVVLTFVYSFFVTTPQYWLQLWTESDGRSTTFYMLGFLFLSFMSWSSTSIGMWSVLIQLAPQSGSRIHQRLLHIVTGAPLSYFSKTENGSILNRFSQDIQLVDKKLPSALQSLLVQIAKLFMQIVLLFIVQKWLALSLPICVILVYFIQKVYLRTSRQLRFLELESRAGVFSSFLESIEGLETIRAFGWSKAVIQQNNQRVDDSQRPEFLLLCLQRWLNLVLDILSAAIATGVVVMAVTFREQISGAQVGIALNIMLVANTTLLKLVENWTTLEISLGAIARLKTLGETTPVEGGVEVSLDPPDNWPSRGEVEFKNITASYNSEPVAINNMTLNVPAGQKLIVCGRTGSGKSTLLATLLRLLELQSGTIEIDGIDIKNISLDILRRRCFIAVSQDPLVLSNETLRFNLDPDGFASDEFIIETLIKTGLWLHFSTSGATEINVINIPESGEHPILDRKVSTFQQLSVGQSQLFALSRALIKGNVLAGQGLKPVVLLDEVTSSLDSVTESTIYKIIDEEFTQRENTVIVVAHRLNVLSEFTVNGRDAVAIMGDGVLREVVTDLRPEDLGRLGEMN